MTRAVLSIGSNLGDRTAALRAVITGLGNRVRAVSAVYRTAAWGGVDQRDFFNAIVLVADPNLDCYDWLRLGQQFEAAAGRVREVRWGPRTLDVDVIDCEARVNTDPELMLPHPQAHRRAFVLVPWLDVDPDAQLMVAGRLCRVEELYKGLDQGEVAGVVRTEERLWQGARA